MRKEKLWLLVAVGFIIVKRLSTRTQDRMSNLNKFLSSTQDGSRLFIDDEADVL